MARSKQSGGANFDVDGNGSGIEGANIGNGDVAGIAAGQLIIDPAAVSGSGSSGDGSGDTAGEPVKKRRGRKPGSTNKAKGSTLDISGLEAILLSTHTMLAALTSPVMKIDSEEAKVLATGVSNVARHYDISATEKTLDWANLFMALGAVYGPRIMLADWRKKPKPKANGAVPAHEVDPNQTAFPFGGNAFPGAGSIRN